MASDSDSNATDHGGQPKLATLSVGPRARASALLRGKLCAAGLTQEQAGRLVGKDARQVRRWLSGRHALGALELLAELEALETKRAA